MVGFESQTQCFPGSGLSSQSCCQADDKKHRFHTRSMAQEALRVVRLAQNKCKKFVKLAQPALALTSVTLRRLRAREHERIFPGKGNASLTAGGGARLSSARRRTPSIAARRAEDRRA